MGSQSRGDLWAWGAALAASSVLWLWPSIELANAFYGYAKSHFATSQWASVNAWPLVGGAIWSTFLGCIAWDEFRNDSREVASSIFVIAAIGIILPAAGSVLMAAAPIPFSSPIRTPLNLTIFFAEVPIAACLFARYMRQARDDRIVLRTLKALSVSFSGLTAVKVAALSLLPGVSIRLTFPV